MQDFEKIILKNIIENPEYFSKSKTILEPSIFSDFANSQIYKIIIDFYKDYNKVPSLLEIAIKTKDIPNAEVRKQIGTSLSEIKNTENIEPKFLDDFTVKFVKDSLFTKALMVGADYIDKKDESYKQQAFKIIEKMNLININADLGANYANIEERFDYYQNPEKGINYTRFSNLSSRLGEGFLPGTLNLFLAPPGVGKSLMMSSSITDFLLQKKNILLVSMEMNSFEFMKRIDADLLDANIYDLKNIDPYPLINKFKNMEIGKLYVQNYPAGSFSSDNLEQLIELYKTNGITFDLIFLDYLGIMKSSLITPNAGLYSYLKSIAEEVRASAKRHNIPIISCSQLNRAAINNKESDNSAISDSLGIAMSADFMCFLIQNEEMKKQNKIIFKITKNRYTGRTDTFSMNVDYAHMRFTDESADLTISEAEVIDMTNSEAKKAVDAIEFDWDS